MEMILMKAHTKTKPIIKHTPDGQPIEISPYIWGVMHGEPPIYLEDEEKAIEIAKKLGWKADPSSHAEGAVAPVSAEEAAENRKFLQACGVDMDEWDRIIKQGGGTMPGWHAKKKD
jgi:hypothetical protein